MSSNMNVNGISSIGTSVQQSLHNTQKSQKKLDQSFEKLSTGKRINKPSDDIVGAFKAVSLETVSRGIEAVSQYTSFRSSELGIEQGSLSQNLESLQKARELAVRGADDNLSPQEREGLTNQLNDLGVRDIDLSDSTSANASLTTLDGAITDVASRLSQIGSESNTLDLREQADQSQLVQIESARSRIEDADIAQVVSQQVQNQIRLGLSIQVLQRAQHVSASSALGFLP